MRWKAYLSKDSRLSLNPGLPGDLVYIAADTYTTWSPPGFYRPSTTA